MPKHNKNSEGVMENKKRSKLARIIEKYKAKMEDLNCELHEISPYATFSMSGSAAAAAGAAAGSGAGAGAGCEEGVVGCALHLHTFGRAELDLAAPPPRPNLLAHTPEYGRSRDSDSESSGSPCAACAAELYRLPAAHLSDTLPAVESSAEDTVYSAQAGRARGRHAPRARRRRHDNQPNVRYQAARALPGPL